MNNDIYTVLLADINIESTKNLEERLLKEGFRVLSVDSGYEAVSLVKERKINIAIIDVNLKDIEGYEIVPLIKNINEDIKVIITTLKNFPELEGKCRATGIIYYAIKPINNEEIVDIIKYALKKI